MYVRGWSEGVHWAMRERLSSSAAGVVHLDCVQKVVALHGVASLIAPPRFCLFNQQLLGALFSCMQVVPVLLHKFALLTAAQGDQ